MSHRGDFLETKRETSTSSSSGSGITEAQEAAIAANTAKVGFTDAAVAANSAVAANTAKVGITTSQASAIVDNTAKVTYPGNTAIDARIADHPTVVVNTAKTGVSTVPWGVPVFDRFSACAWSIHGLIGNSEKGAWRASVGNIRNKLEDWLDDALISSASTIYYDSDGSAGSASSYAYYMMQALLSGAGGLNGSDVWGPFTSSSVLYISKSSANAIMDFDMSGSAAGDGTHSVGTVAYNGTAIDAKVLATSKLSNASTAMCEILEIRCKSSQTDKRRFVMRVEGTGACAVYLSKSTADDGGENGDASDYVQVTHASGGSVNLRKDAELVCFNNEWGWKDDTSMGGDAMSHADIEMEGGNKLYIVMLDSNLYDTMDYHRVTFAPGYNLDNS